MTIWSIPGNEYKGKMFNYMPQGDMAVILTLKHREKHGCVVSTVATDALVLKHQAISIHNAD